MDLLRLDRPVGLLQVLDGDLRLAARSQPPKVAALSHIRELLAQFRSYRMRQWHAILRLVCGVTKHDALITGAYIEIIFADVYATRDIRALLVDSYQHFASPVAQALTVDTGHVLNIRIESYLLDNTSDDLLVASLRLCGYLAGNHDHVVPW